MKNLLFLLSLYAVSVTVYSQSSQPPYSVSSDTLDHILDAKYIQLLADVNNKLNIEEVRSAAMDSTFKYLPEILATDSGSSNTYWIRYRIKNESATTLRLSFITVANKASFYLIDSLGTVSHYKTGYSYDYKERDGLKGATAVPIELMPHETYTVYYKRYTQDKQDGFLKGLEVTLMSTSKLVMQQLNNYDEKYFSGHYFLRGAFFGFLVLAGCFNFFFFLIVRERVYLHFCLFLLTYSATDNYYFSDVLFSGNNIANFLLESTLILDMFFLTQFARYYFKTFTLWPRWDKALKFSLVLLIAQFLFYLFWTLFNMNLPPGDWEDFTQGTPIILSIVFLFITMSLALKRSVRESRFFLLAIAPLVLCFLIFFSIVIAASISDTTNDGVLGQLQSWIESWGDNIISLTICWAAVVFSWALFNRYNLQRKEIASHSLEKERLAKEKEIERNQLIEQQKVQLEKDVADRTYDLKKSIDELKATQSQLIQSEKMASLGELTAGIAHEIQNPLNFVNNFSEVSGELVAEMNTELEKGNTEDAKQIAQDLKQNLEKINHHGKRAGDIVKGMLQHSRSSSGKKEPTDINKLADEYLRLAYHGLRAKDKSFNAIMKTDFDESIGNINVVPQDIGRVILNLITNAFYAVNEKFKVESSKSGSSYEPTVTISTKKEGNKILITVKDNGNGIPDHIKEKIFQPFFTTKPTGQGTGLGLSLSYDIVKAHGGELKVESKEEEGSTFNIQLPIS